MIPAWMKYVWRENPARFVRFAENIIGIREGSDEEKILRAIACLEAFYKALEAPVTLKELGADAAPLAELAKLAASRGAIGNFKKLTVEDALRIYELAR
jgi:alcohol dehydrogenase YqhD (iron-dependent ADH family)